MNANTAIDTHKHLFTTELEKIPMFSSNTTDPIRNRLNELKHTKPEYFMAAFMESLSIANQFLDKEDIRTQRANVWLSERDAELSRVKRRLNEIAPECADCGKSLLYEIDGTVETIGDDLFCKSCQEK